MLGWNSNTLATWCKEITHWNRPWCWGSLKVGGKGDDRGWNGWTASLTWWTCIWVGLGVGDGQGSLAWCSPWVCKVSDTTEQLNRTELIHVSVNMLSPFDYCKWMYKYLFDILLSVLLDICPEVGLLDCMVAIFLVFWRIAILFFIAAEPFYIPTKGFNFSMFSLSSFLPPSIPTPSSLSFSFPFFFPTPW